MAYTVRLLLAAFYRQTSLIFPGNIPPYQIILLQMLTESFPRRLIKSHFFITSDYNSKQKRL